MDGFINRTRNQEATSPTVDGEVLLPLDGITPSCGIKLHDPLNRLTCIDSLRLKARLLEFPPAFSQHSRISSGTQAQASRVAPG